MNATTTSTIRANRRQAKANTRTVARNLRAAAKRNDLSLAGLLHLERTNGVGTGRLLLALTGVRLTFAHLLILQSALKLSIEDTFAGTSTKPVGA